MKKRQGSLKVLPGPNDRWPVRAPPTPPRDEAAHLRGQRSFLRVLMGLGLYAPGDWSRLKRTRWVRGVRVRVRVPKQQLFSHALERRLRTIYNLFWCWESSPNPEPLRLRLLGHLKGIAAPLRTRLVQMLTESPEVERVLWG